jgi:hypothetical protein
MTVNDWQWTNQFFDQGRISSYYKQDENMCPYDPSKFVKENEIQKETYRKEEWLAGYNYQLISETLNEEHSNR